MAIPVFDDLDMNTNRVRDTSDPLLDTDGATKRYVDNEIRKLDWKQSVRVATTGNIGIAAPGASIDGVAMVAGDRFLAWQQTTGSENGLYVWNGAAIPATRSVDADDNVEVTAGMVVSTSEGAAHLDRSFFLTTNDPITVGVTTLVFVIFAGGGGGEFKQIVGDGVTLSFAVTHNLNDSTPSVVVREIATGDLVLARIVVVNVNTVNVSFNPAPVLNGMEVAVRG
ncbi:MAG: hypothetical protein ACREIE_00590 [Nitrospiraceae bacterium]